ncbi:MAG: hypothetical protein ABI629_15605 [bacterium]
MAGRAAVWGLVVLLVAGAHLPASAASPCATNSDCAPQTYCDHPLGQCSGSGQCRTRLFECPALWNPACGCDGRSYESACNAEVLGVDAAHLGSCCLGACLSLDRVTVEDLTIGVEQSLGLSSALCHSFDRDQNQRVTIDELLAAVRNAMHGCP